MESAHSPEYGARKRILFVFMNPRHLIFDGRPLKNAENVFDSGVAQMGCKKHELPGPTRHIASMVYIHLKLPMV
jgi:hypothetical protein